MRLLDILSSLLGSVGGPRDLAYRPYSRACCACIFLLIVFVAAAALGAVLLLHR